MSACHTTPLGDWTCGPSFTTKKKSWGGAPRTVGVYPPMRNKDYFLASKPPGAHCFSPPPLMFLERSSLQGNITYLAVSCHIPGRRMSAIPPAKPSVRIIVPFGKAGSVKATARYLPMSRRDCREGYKIQFAITLCVSTAGTPIP